MPYSSPFLAPCHCQEAKTSLDPDPGSHNRLSGHYPRHNRRSCHDRQVGLLHRLMEVMQWAHNRTLRRKRSRCEIYLRWLPGLTIELWARKAAFLRILAFREFEEEERRRWKREEIKGTARTAEWLSSCGPSSLPGCMRE